MRNEIQDSDDDDDDGLASSIGIAAEIEHAVTGTDKGNGSNPSLNGTGSTGAS